MFHLVLDCRRNLVHQLHHVRTQLAGLGIDNLEFFLYADGEAVSHGWPSGSVNRSAVALNKASLGTSPVSYPTSRTPRVHQVFFWASIWLALRSVHSSLAFTAISQVRGLYSLSCRGYNSHIRWSFDAHRKCRRTEK